MANGGIAEVLDLPSGDHSPSSNDAFEALPDDRKDEIQGSRKTADWPSRGGELEALWEKQVVGDLLTENLRLEAMQRVLPVEHQKDHPNPKQAISLRYQRTLQAVEKADEQDIASYFLSAVALACEGDPSYPVPRRHK